MIRPPTISRATGFGAVAGLITILLWIAYGWWPETFVLPYVLGLLVTAGCGLFVLLATARDRYRNPRRGVRIRPIRGFDVAAGLLLAAPALWGLWPFLPALT